MRKITDFNKWWKFHRGDIDDTAPTTKGPLYIQSKTERMKWGPACRYYTCYPDDYGNTHEIVRDRWDFVNLPHDYIIGGETKKENNNALGFFDYDNAWYRKEFVIPEEYAGKRITLEFDGVATNCTVYFNGCILKRNFCGYTPFEVDITDFAEIGKTNVVAVYVDGTHFEGWWYNGAGIYRHVRLVATEKLCVEKYGVFNYAKKENGKWNIYFETSLLNISDIDETATVKSVVYDKENKPCATATSCGDILSRGKAVLKYNAKIDTPHLWDIDDPYIYNVITTVEKNGEIIDEFKSVLGIREFSFDAENGFKLNGRYVKINGVCGHEDCGLSGKAVPDNINRYKVSLMKEMGANGYRTAHYPQNEATMDALDANGFIVLDETRWYDSSEEGLKQLETLIKRDRNRPSVFMWSVGNEEPIHTTENGVNIYKTMASLVKKLDPTRPITTAVSNSPATAPVQEFVDIIGVNYFPETFDVLHEKYPDKPFVSTENCATGTTRRWHYDQDDSRAFLPAYDRDSVGNFYSREFYQKHISSRAYVAGGYQWIAFEHRGEAVWPRLCSQSGAIDLYLQKKDAFYQNKANWTENEPVIHMLPHWNMPHGIGEPIDVYVYTNCEEAELFINGKSCGRKAMPEKYTKLLWNVLYEPGNVCVKGYIGGKEVVSDGHITSGRPYALKLKLDNNPDDIHANTYDGIVVTAYCVDENGIEVPDAALERIDFTTNSLGNVYSTGSDITDHSSLLLPYRSMRAGRTTALIIAGDKKGTLKVYAESAGLLPARLDVELK